MGMLSGALGVGGALLGGIGDYQAAKREQKGAEQGVEYLTSQRRAGQEKAEEKYGEYTPAGGLGMDALQSQYDMLVGGDMSNFFESPGYQFAMEQGVQSRERGAAARGGLLGGGQMKELTRFGQGLASKDFGNYLQQLSGLTSQGINTGMQATGGIMSQYGGVAPGSIAQAMMNVGTAKGAKQAAPWRTGGNMMNVGAGQAGYSEGQQNQMDMMKMIYGGGGVV